MEGKTSRKGKTGKGLLPATIAICMVLASLLAGCATTATPAPTTAAQQTTAATEAPTVAATVAATEAPTAQPTVTPPAKIRIYRMATDITDATSTVLKELEADTNTKIEFVTAPWDQWVAKLNTLMATGEQLDMVTCDLTNPYVQWAKEGLVLSYDDVIDPNTDVYIDKVTKSPIFKSLMVDGKRYYLPNIHPGNSWSMYVRTDLLEQVGISPDSVVTMDDYYNAMKAVHDKTGAYGFAFGNNDFQFVTSIIGGFGGGGYIPEGNSFVVNNGTLEDLSISDKTKAGLVFLNKMYREGLMNQDFVTNKDSDGTYVATGKAMSFFQWEGGAQSLLANMNKVDPNAKVQAIKPFNLNNGFEPRQGGFIFWLLTFIPKTAADPGRVVDLIEFINSKDGRDLLAAGPKSWLSPEGVAADGTFTLTVDPATRKAEWGSETAYSGLNYIFASHMNGYIPVRDYATFEEAYQNRVIYIESNMVTNQFNNRDALKNGSLYSKEDMLAETHLTVDNDIRPKINTIKFEAWDKIIMEKDPANIDALWSEYVSAWKSSGGDDRVKAYQEWYDANK